ncbi:MAG TPA: hypothetical protein PL065_09950 [Polyangiaceae bacterium]|nr:hypothetical protein [Polyangiaceae bacterium]
MKKGRVVLGGASALVLLAVSAVAAPPLMSRDDIICRAKSGVGFSYYWGGACWCASGCSRNFSCPAGSCSGNCPNCTHYGQYGADCSGYVTKIWQIPNPISVSTCGHGPYVASMYTKTSSYWTVISRNSLQPGDSMASSAHVLLYEQGDPWGSLVAYEARGCSSGIVRNWRTCSGDYVAARRINLGTPCACTPGAKENRGCGQCGTQSRTCGSNCQWEGWGACTGQGPCAAGTSEKRNCCDCGTQSRSCTSSCQWAEWSACDGPDPEGGTLSCDTGEPGPCAEGRIRCVQGCKTCRRVVDPTPELCDEVDNDCNGQVDDGHPTELGDPPPAFAATLVDHSIPVVMHHGEQATVWAAFRNDGSKRWNKNEIWLGATTVDAEAALYDPESWAAYDIAALLDTDVEPGQVGVLTWSIRAPEKGQSSQQTFRLMDPSGSWLRCPSPELQVTVRLSAFGRRAEDGGLADTQQGGENADPSSGCACHHVRAPASWSWAGWLLFALYLGAWASRFSDRSSWRPEDRR